MKRWVVIIGALLVLSLNSMAGSNMMSVQVKDSALRAKPSFLGKPICRVGYGDRVTVLTERAGWSQVSFAGGTGWLHSSSLRKKKIKRSTGGKDLSRTASNDELALAGKGFSEAVEEEYKAQHAEMNFSAVDDMEAIVISENEMRDFLLEGGVITPEGGV